MGRLIPLKLQSKPSHSESQYESRPLPARPFPPRVSSLPPQSSADYGFRPLLSPSSHLSSPLLPSCPSSPSASGHEPVLLPPSLPARSSSLPPQMPLGLSGRLFKEMPHSRTDTEWRKTLEEVRALYVKGQYKQCSTHCISVLENAMGSIFPLYSVYLSFYAATCLELTARPLHINAPQKLLLFELARFHYGKAEFHIAEAILEPSSPECLSFKAPERQASSTPGRTIARSRQSSITSMTDSVSSTFNSLVMSSPTSSICSTSSISQEEPPGHLRLIPRPLRIGKRVPFSPRLPTVLSASSIQSAAPDTPKKVDFRNESSPGAGLTSLPSSCDHSNVTLSTYLLSLSVTRYHAKLSSLNEQVRYHISVLEALIGETQRAREIPNSCTDSCHQLHEVESCGITRNFSLKNCGANLWKAGADAKVRQQRAAKIAALKERVRFDGKKWKDLCEDVLMELGEQAV